MPGKGATSPSLYQAFGGRAACLRLAQAFYARVRHDPVLRPLFPGKSLRCAIEEFSAFLAQFLGGPGEDIQRRWWLSLRESHLRFKIGERERQAWMANMVKAFEDVQVQEPMRSELLAFFQRSSAYVVNQERAAATAKDACSIPENGMGVEISERWKAQILLDDVVTAIRSRNADRAIELAESQSLQASGRSTYSGLLAQMLRSGERLLLDYVCAKLTHDPTLAREHYAGRTLLHEAAAAGSLTAVELLLSLGADPNSQDSGGHTPLYCVANECAAKGAGQVVRALARAGGNVDADDGVKHCSPLHMAARRGNVEVAEALLDCGADIESRDTVGDTPLRRAVNCNKAEVASLLLAKGADAQSKGSKGLTAIVAARTTAMKQCLQRAIEQQTRR